MPIKFAAKKALRSSKKKYQKNILIKKNLKDSIKKASEKNINNVFSIIDKAAKNNVINKNKAARLKASLAKKVGKTPKAEKKAQVKPKTKKIAKKITKK